jgi:hypothetical protein
MKKKQVGNVKQRFIFFAKKPIILAYNIYAITQFWDSRSKYVL